MSTSITILIVEDDKELARLLQLDLEVNGFKAITAHDGVEGLRKFRELVPELLVLDVSLPGMDGLTVCKRVREFSDVPILMMTAHAISDEEIANGLNIGADEYMIKPISEIEFHARVRALLRRARLAEHSKEQGGQYTDDYLTVDLNTRRVKVNGQEVRLTPTEFKLLAMFIQNRGEVLTFQQLLEKVWGPEYKNEHHYPRIYVSHLRRKIEPDIKMPTYIHNEYGVGYRFVGGTPA
jgi:two-component system KDP operon response regulator KdpE